MKVVFLAAVLIGVNAWNRPNHWGNPCYLCKCFVEYTDRDVALPVKPYAMARDGYETTEDTCLATCLREERCKAAVYGMVGGRKVFTCEFYEELDARNTPMYTPFVNMYFKRAACALPTANFPSVWMVDADESSIKRRKKQVKNQARPNPFFG